MKINSLIILVVFLTIVSCNSKNSKKEDVVKVETSEATLLQRWSVDRANKWYETQGWLVGANYAPASAINQLEMWQEETFDPDRIDLELRWAEELGFNTMRVFLHDLVWKQNAKAYLERIDTYLELAHSYGIKTMLVLLDDVWDPNPKLGQQKAPILGVHNSGWVQSPGKDVLIDSLQWKRLEHYIKGVISHFKDDKRVIIWDLYNEPGNLNSNSYGEFEPKNKEVHSLNLMKKVFTWAREVNPSQPLCVGVWTSINKPLNQMSAIDAYAYKNSDIINFHCYANAETTRSMVERLASSNRPLICTEYLARAVGSTFKDILPVFKKHHVACYNWGFVSGKSQTIYPWDSWEKPYNQEPELWFHDIYREDGSPYKMKEVQFIKELLSK
ncbi:cellulase family glycosylhydrolase [Snuella sedimenti]|uniref:Cellulase family glycosylhydrolase n=1 Tax=Snuella sedimenti TaxID=2798802 RepID=A0A8J7IZJ8_9FLAO|nr:cellulase family glycosylhydrolase [Snuella sedimenti]MBJ6369560.1 cellulase family glycosylhydrolase [Snuella sedimenti]